MKDGQAGQNGQMVRNDFRIRKVKEVREDPKDKKVMISLDALVI